MKHQTQIIMMAAALALGTPAFANDNPSATSSERTSTSNSSVRLSKLMDADIKSNKGEDLGDLQDLLIDPQTGEIEFAVLGRGGFLGIGERHVPVPWKAIHVQSEKQFSLNVDKDKLKTAPTTDKEYSNMQEPGYTVRIYRFFALPADSAMGGADTPGGVQQDHGSSTNQTPDRPKASSDTVYQDPYNSADKD